MTVSQNDIGLLLGRLHSGVWELTALVLALRDDNPEAHAVLAELGLMEDGGLAPPLAEHIRANALDVASDLSAPILQSASLISGAKDWTAQDDDALVAQGRASAQGVPLVKAFVVPMLEGLAELLEGPAPEMLDVGVGTAAMAAAYCQNFERLRIVGLDVFPHVLQIAERVVREAGMSERIELRNQDVAMLDDVDRFAVVWLPAPFIPRPALEAAIPRMVAALLPGGWFVFPHGKFGDDARENAISRFKTAAFGGTALDDDEAEGMLRSAGLTDVKTLPTPPGAPALTVGRRPASR
jgi:SAM-dependent methyltransferase